MVRCAIARALSARGVSGLGAWCVWRDERRASHGMKPILSWPQWVGLFDASAVCRRSLLQGRRWTPRFTCRRPKTTDRGFAAADFQLHRLYGQPAGLLNHRQRRVDGVDDGGGPVDLRICVSGDCHVLDRLSDCEGLYRKEICHPEDPRLLGFEAQRVLLETLPCR